MKTILSKLGIALAGVLSLIVTTTHADTFGTGPNDFTIDFVNIGNAGNTDDTGAGGGSYSSPYGGVPYAYRMGTYEISQDAITKATAGGLLNVTAGAWAGNQPAANMTWFEAAAFVNWLNQQHYSNASFKAYNLDPTNTTLTLWSSADAWTLGGENLYRHKDAYYFLPSENEWYKAAYHKNDGVTANYWDYATGSNAIPDGIDFSGDTAFDAVFDDGFEQVAPNDVTTVGLTSPYGTFGQNGNVYELTETALDGINDLAPELRTRRGGNWVRGETNLRSSTRVDADPPNAGDTLGLRVASVVPESSSTVLMCSAGLLALARRRRCAALWTVSGAAGAKANSLQSMAPIFRA
jgi:hypothetical protein